MQAGADGRRFDAQSGDRYTGWVEPNSAAVSLPDDAGSLRITRVNGVETTYFRQRGFWQKLAVGVSRGGAVLGLQALVAEADAFGHQEVKVAFDNFTVTAADAICPAGTEPG